MQSENYFDVPTTSRAIEDVLGSYYYRTYRSTYTENFLINSLKIKEMFKSFNEQVGSTFVFDKIANFCYYENDNYSNKPIELKTAFFMLSGIRNIDVSCHHVDFSRINCTVIVILTDECLKDHEIPIRCLFDEKKDPVSTLVEEIRREVQYGNRGIKMTFRRAKRKKPTKSSKSVQNVKNPVS